MLHAYSYAWNCWNISVLIPITPLYINVKKTSYRYSHWINTYLIPISTDIICDSFILNSRMCMALFASHVYLTNSRVLRLSLYYMNSARDVCIYVTVILALVAISFSDLYSPIVRKDWVLSSRHVTTCRYISNYFHANSLRAHILGYRLAKFAFIMFKMIPNHIKQSYPVFMTIWKGCVFFKRAIFSFSETTWTFSLPRMSPKGLVDFGQASAYRLQKRFQNKLFI